MDKKCPYVNNCTLYADNDKKSALTEEVKKLMCENIHKHRREPVIPASRGWGDGSGSVCEAYSSKRLLEELIESAKKDLEKPLKEKYQPGTI